MVSAPRQRRDAASVDLSPGSRAKRYFTCFGAGAAGTKVTGEIVDAQSGEVLARFTQGRRSGGTWKVGGGKDMDDMRDSIHATGQDIAHILDHTPVQNSSCDPT